MGRRLLQTIRDSHNVVLGAALDRSNSRYCGMRIEALDRQETSKIRIHHDLNQVRDDFDVLIDFTCPQSSLNCIEFCRRHRKNVVLGTTGFVDAERRFIGRVSKKIAIVFSPNFGIGINMIASLLGKITRTFGKDCDVAVIDTHHRTKIDSPSGTALFLGECVAQQWSSDSSTNVRNRRGIHGRRVDFSSVRIGEVVGEHTVWFANDREHLKLNHRVLDRTVFAAGAVRSALWLKDKRCGLFDMRHVLGLQKS